MLKLWRFVRSGLPRVENFSRLLLTLTLVFSFAVLLFLTLLMAAFLATDLTAKSNTDPPAWASWLTSLSLGLLFDQPKKLPHGADTYIVSVTFYTLLAAISLWATFVPFLGIRKYRRDLKDAAIVDISPVDEVGKGDLDTMYDYYRKGTQIIVFSGDFDWILIHEKLRELIVRLARQGKILFVSYKDESQIEQSWGDRAANLNLAEDTHTNILQEIRSRFRFHNKRFKFTLVHLGADQYSFLSLVPAYPGGVGEDANIGVHSGKNPQASALVHIVRELCDPEGCESLRPWRQD